MLVVVIRKISMKLQSSKQIVLKSFFGLLLLAGGMKAIDQNVEDRETVFTVRLARHTLARTLKAKGVLHEQLRVNISSKIIGEVREVFRIEGDRVTPGMPLIQLDRLQYEIAVRKEEANLRISLAQLARDSLVRKHALIELERFRALFQKELISQQEFTREELDCEIAQKQLYTSVQRYTQALENLDDARDALTKTLIVAPIAGIVVRKDVEVGETVIPGTINNSGSILLVLANLDTMFVDVEISETDLHRIRIGQEAHLRLESYQDTTFIAEVRTASPIPYERDGQTYFRIRAVLREHNNPLLRPGMTATVSLASDDHRTRWCLPLEAVMTEEQKNADPKSFVLIVRPDNSIDRCDVITGAGDLDQVEIQDGIDTTDQVICGPQRVLNRLVVGERVAVGNPAGLP